MGKVPKISYCYLCRFFWWWQWSHPHWWCGWIGRTCRRWWWGNLTKKNFEACIWVFFSPIIIITISMLLAHTFCLSLLLGRYVDCLRCTASLWAINRKMVQPLDIKSIGCSHCNLIYWLGRWQTSGVYHNALKLSVLWLFNCNDLFIGHISWGKHLPCWESIIVRKECLTKVYWRTIR